MTRSQRGLATLIGLMVGLLLVFALVYQFLMRTFEGQERGFWRALGWSAETLSTTGYGADSVWTHPVLVAFVALVQFAGVFLIFLVFPIYLIPFLEERFEKRLPREAPPLEDHVVVLRFGAAVETLLADLKEAGVPAIVVEDDEARARKVSDRGLQVVVGQVSEGVLERARLGSARGLVLNASDDEDALAALVARQSGFEKDVIALVEEPALRQPLVLAGASRVFTPRHVLGAAMAARASRRIRPTVSGLGEVGTRLRIAEIRVAPKARLAGRTLAEAGVGSRYGVAVLGLWVHGRLRTDAGPESRLDSGSIVIAAGAEEALEEFAAEISVPGAAQHRGRFVMAGLGEVGKTARDVLVSVGEEVVTLDRDAATGADFVGDFLDPSFVEKAEPERADAVLLALDTDASTLFATLVVRDRAPHVPIVARVNEAVNVERIHLAGADFALSISQVTAQIVSHRLLGEQAVQVEAGLRVKGIAVPEGRGAVLGDLRLRESFACSAVALERDDSLRVVLSEATEIEPGDVLYLAGDADALRRAGERIGGSVTA